MKYILKDNKYISLKIILHRLNEDQFKKFLSNSLICKDIKCVNSKITKKNYPEYYLDNNTHWNKKGNKIFEKKIINLLK